MNIAVPMEIPTPFAAKRSSILDGIPASKHAPFVLTKSHNSKNYKCHMMQDTYFCFRPMGRSESV